MKLPLLILAVSVAAIPFNSPRSPSGYQVDTILSNIANKAGNWDGETKQALRMYLPLILKCQNQPEMAKWVENNFEDFMEHVVSSIKASGQDSGQNTSMKEHLEANLDGMLDCLVTIEKYTRRKAPENNTRLKDLLSSFRVKRCEVKDLVSDEQDSHHNVTAYSPQQGRDVWPSQRCIEICSHMKTEDDFSRCRELCPRLNIEFANNATAEDFKKDDSRG